MVLQVLLSVTSLVVLLIVIAVGVASYAGTTIALRRFFRGNSGTRLTDDP